MICSNMSTQITQEILPFCKVINMFEQQMSVVWNIEYDFYCSQNLIDNCIQLILLLTILLFCQYVIF